MDRFIYDSSEFWDELKDSPHHAGEVEFLRSITRPGMCAVDAGANKGVTAVAIAREAGKTGCVHAFEPVPEFYAELNGNLARNGVENVSTHMLALSNHTGRVRFYKHGGGSGIAAVEDAEMIWVEATSLRDFSVGQKIGRIDLLSLDCEGSELLVFQGAKGILKEQGPEIFCEIHHGYLKDLGQSANDVAGLLRSVGYDVRPLRVEDLGAETSLEKCSHIYASRRRGRGKARPRKKAAREGKGGAPARPLGTGDQTGTSVT